MSGVWGFYDEQRAWADVGMSPGLVYVRDLSNKGQGKRRGRLTPQPQGLSGVLCACPAAP